MLSSVAIFLLLVAPVVGWGTFRSLPLIRLPRLKFPLAFGASILLCAIAYVLFGELVSFEARSRLDTFDLDHDGMFSTAEMTDDARKAMDALTHDTGRSMIPLVALPFAIVYSSTIFAVLEICRAAYLRFRRPPTIAAPL